MPVSSIQHRSKIGNHQKQVFLTRAKKIKIFEPGDCKISLEMMGLFKQILEAKKSQLVLQTEHCPEITIGNQNIVKTSLLLLMLLSIPQRNGSLVGINDSRNPSSGCNTNSSGHALPSHGCNFKPSSWTDELVRIPQKIANSFDNLMAYDPLKFPIADAAPILKPLHAKKSIHKIRHTGSNHLNCDIMKRENKKLSSFLKKHGLLDKDNKEITKEELISAVFGYCSNGEFQDSRKIAKRILTASRPYESEKHESLSSRQVEAVIGNWVFKNILDATPTEYVAIIISKDKHRLNYTINDVMHLLSLEKLQEDEIINLNTLSLEMNSNFKKGWHNHIIKEMPFLDFCKEDKSVGTILLKDLEFSNLYTGARYLSDLKNLNDSNQTESTAEVGEKIWEQAISNRANMTMQPYLLTHSILYTGAPYLSDFKNLNDFNQTEAAEIGEKIWEQAISNGASMAMEPYLLTPSMFFEAQHTPQKITKTKNIHALSETVIIEQLEYRETAQRLYTAITEKLHSYKIVLKKWLNREKIADKNEYNELAVEVANRFSELDEYLILFALNSAGHDEMKFIFSPDGIIRSVTFNMQTRNSHTPIIPFVGTTCVDSNSRPISCTNTKHIKVGLDKTDIFSVCVGDEERIYAFKNANNEYNLFRVDRDITKYIDADILDYKEIREEYSISHNKIKIGGRTFHFNFTNSKTLLKGKEDSTIKFIDFLKNKHRNNLSISLYQTDDDPSILQQIWGGIKHFLPFYDCIERVVNKDSQQAVRNCLIDAVIFIPVIGESAFMAEKFSLNLAKGLRRGGISLNKGSGSAIGVGRAALREINLPTINELSSLGENTLRSLDPGFQLLGSISRKYADKLISSLNKDEKTVALSKKLQSIVSTKKFPSPSDAYITARLPDSEIRVPVRKVDEKEGQNIYAILNPETGESAWARFIIKENNQLTSLDPCPQVSISKALKKMITPDMYAKNVDIQKLSTPDYMGLRWDSDHRNAYLNFENNFLRINILNNQLFLISENHLVPLIIKNHQLRLEGLLHRLIRLKKEGLSGRNQSAKQLIASKINISEEQASELLDKYEFPQMSNYYSDKTFALWIKETGQIPEWAESFKILDSINYSSRFRNIEIQDNGLYSFSGGEGFAYRVDKNPPNIVLTKGFLSSEDYTAVEKMIPESEPGLIVSGDITGALRYNELAKAPYIYKITLENVRGVSLKENLMKNQSGLKSFLGEDDDETYTTIESLAVDSNGAIYLDEVHLYNRDIKPQDISILTREELEQAQPLSQGPWINYL